jgi:hypothetical protein
VESSRRSTNLVKIWRKDRRYWSGSSGLVSV